MESSDREKHNAIAKEVASSIAAVFRTYKLENSAGAGTSLADLLPQLNYVAEDTTTIVDWNPPGTATADCSMAPLSCYRLHSGAMLFWWQGLPAVEHTFAGTTSLHAVRFYVDPDGKTSGTRSVVFWLYYDGKLRTYGTIEPATLTGSSSNPFNPTALNDPSWFGWD